MYDRSERTLRRGQLVFEVRDSLIVTLGSGDASDQIVLPYPRLGYGGHELVVSPDEDYVALDPDEVNEWTTYGAMRFVSATTIELTTPWGERIACSLPITGLPSGTYTEN